MHAWISRYERGGLAALADRSHRPATCPHQVPPELEARICELRRQHPGWGPRRIENQLARAGIDLVPSRSAIYRCLKRHGLIELRRRRKRRYEFRCFERDRPMQLWQMDVMGGVLLEDGTELKVVTSVDDHSRFCVAAGLVPRATSKAVCAVFPAALRRWGIPDEVLTDNGKVFTGGSDLSRSRCSSTGSAARTGSLTAIPTSARRPRPGRSSGSIRACARSSSSRGPSPPWRRVRQSSTPGSRTTTRPVPTRPSTWRRRRSGSASHNGLVSVDNQMFSVGNAYKAQLVDVFVDDTVIQVWHQNHLIKPVARVRKGRVRKVRADALHVKDQPATKRQASAGT